MVNECEIPLALLDKMDVLGKPYILGTTVMIMFRSQFIIVDSLFAIETAALLNWGGNVACVSQTIRVSFLAAHGFRRAQSVIPERLLSDSNLKIGP